MKKLNQTIYSTIFVVTFALFGATNTHAMEVDDTAPASRTLRRQRRGRSGAKTAVVDGKEARTPKRKAGAITAGKKRRGRSADAAPRGDGSDGEGGAGGGGGGAGAEEDRMDLDAASAAAPVAGVRRGGASSRGDGSKKEDTARPRVKRTREEKAGAMAAAMYYAAAAKQAWDSWGVKSQLQKNQDLIVAVQNRDLEAVIAALEEADTSYVCLTGETALQIAIRLGYKEISSPIELKIAQMIDAEKARIRQEQAEELRREQNDIEERLLLESAAAYRKFREEGRDEKQKQITKHDTKAAETRARLLAKLDADFVEASAAEEARLKLIEREAAAQEIEAARLRFEEEVTKRCAEIDAKSKK